MDSPGLYNLGDRQISTPLDGIVITQGTSESGSAVSYLDRLDGAIGATFYANFTWGGGGTSVVAVVETSLDGVTWVEVAKFAFATTSVPKVLNIVAQTEILSAYTPAALSNDTAKSGVFGFRWRCKVTSVGTYTNNTMLSTRMAIR